MRGGDRPVPKGYRVSSSAVSGSEQMRIPLRGEHADHRAHGVANEHHVQQIEFLTELVDVAP